MGMGGISIWQLAIILLITTMLFGTGKLKTLGSDLGGAIQGFRKAVKDEETDAQQDDAALEQQLSNNNP